MKRLRFLDLFAGIGGFRMGLERAGHVCVGHVEIDKFANRSYEAIYQPGEEEFFHNDITTITDEHIQRLKELRIDLIAGGFPCQAFSIAGKRAGFDDTRGTLFFDIARLAKEIQPKYLLLENVKGLLNHGKGDTFEIILRTLDEIGYDAEWQVLNSKHFGVPQNRERVFIIGHSRASGGRKVFPITSECQSVDGLQGQNVGTITTRTGISGSVGTYIVEGEQSSQGINQIGNLIDTDSFGGNPQVGRVYGIDGISPCLNTMGGGGREPKIMVKDKDTIRIRKLTPKECWRLQGFPDWAFERAKAAGVSDTQLYKQAGNSVTVNVIEAIGKKFYKEELA